MTLIDLADVARLWAPTPQTMARTITAEPASRFSDLLDITDPTSHTGIVPPMWHWFSFTSSVPQNALGEDGHPRDGHFLPPLENRRRMFAGGRLHTTRPFEVGGTYERTSRVKSTDVKDGRSGPLLFVTLERVFTDTAGEVAREEEDIVYRQQQPGESRSSVTASRPDLGAAWHDSSGTKGSVMMPTDPARLFAFSALTYNTHRIHYDAPYAREVEDYPSLVVHGPLLALLMLEVVRRDRSRGNVTEFAYRLSNPAFSGPDVLAVADHSTMTVGSRESARPAATASYYCLERAVRR